MKRKNRIRLAAAGGLLILFILYTAALLLVDVRPIGPRGSLVGFAAVNELMHHLLGVNLLLYTITDLLGLATVLVPIGFALLGLVQLVKRKSLLRIDRSILVLGGFYLLVLLCYLFFELVVVNYRPVLIGGVLEASYPSSTTMLALCIVPTAAMQLRRLIQSKGLRLGVNAFCVLFTALMVIGRVLSGVHWITDIIGGMLLSGALVLLYGSAAEMTA